MKKYFLSLLLVLFAVGLFANNAAAQGYWEDDHGIPNGLTYGMSIGWFGQFDKDTENRENGLSFGLNVGWKWTHFGFSIDGDFSVSPTESRFKDIWTYSISGLFMVFLPITDGIEFTLGGGVGVTGWSLDYEYTERSVQYDWWWDEYYVEEHDHSRTLDSGGWFSAKLKARIDFVFDDFLFGVEFDWLPCMDTDNDTQIVNHIFGVQLHFGGIEAF